MTQPSDSPVVALPALGMAPTSGESFSSTKLTETIGTQRRIAFRTFPPFRVGTLAGVFDADQQRPRDHVGAGADRGRRDLGATGRPLFAPSRCPRTRSATYVANATGARLLLRSQRHQSGTTIHVFLSHLTSGSIFTLSSPTDPQLRPDVTGNEQLDSPPLVDEGVPLTTRQEALPPETLDDLRLQPGLPMVGVSASRGTDPEDVVVISPGGSGFYTIQVTGYNGATSTSPYMIRAATSPPRQTSNVPARSDHRHGRSRRCLVLPNGLNTVFVVNRRQMEGLYGSTAASSVMTALSNNSTAFRKPRLPQRRPLRRALRRGADGVRRVEPQSRQSRGRRTASSQRSTLSSIPRSGLSPTGPDSSTS